ncbi:MAG: hypothetical protein ACRBEQ_08000 [Hyphomonas sp.]
MLRIFILSLVAGLWLAVSTPTALAAGESDQAGPAIDAALEQFLSGEGDALVLLPNQLDKSKLDFSMESLQEVDDWLLAVHTINKLEAGEGRVGETFTRDGRGDNTVIFAGLYLGEVVRLNAKQDWVWQAFETFVATNPAHAQALGADAGLDQYVLVSEQGVSAPINTALKRVLNGKIDSVAYIATFLSEPVDLDKAMSGTDFSNMAPVAAQ